MTLRAKKLRLMSIGYGIAGGIFISLGLIGLLFALTVIHGVSNQTGISILFLLTAGATFLTLAILARKQFKNEIVS